MKKRFLDRNKAFELLNGYGSPLYVYDEVTLRKTARKMSSFLDGYNISYKCHYAVKANSNPTLLMIMKEEGLYVDSMSLGELAIVEHAGFTKDEILYVCNNISQTEMTEVHDKGILMVFDSISQIETFGKVRPNSNILVRINPGVTGIGHSQKVITAGNKTKFGIAKEYFNELREVTKKYNLNIIGLHQHLGSLFLDDKIDDYINGVKALLDLAKDFPNLKIIDLGGGFGISYYPDGRELDFSLLNSKLVPILKDFIISYGNVEFKFEPGRIVVAESSILLGTVEATKVNAGITYIGTDIGMGTIERPSRYDAYHHIETLSLNTREIKANIVGNVCESGDILGEERDIVLPSIGDPILVYDAGAYGFSMSSNYTGRTRPAEILINNNHEIKLIRKRETIEDLLKNII